MKNLLISLLLVMFNVSQAQEDAWIYLSDKSDVENSISNPISILTQRAIDRKNRHSIIIDDRDVPVNENYLTQLKLQTGIIVKAKSKWFNAVHVRGSESDINALASLSFVSEIIFANKNLNAGSRTISQSNKFQVEEQLVSFNYGNTQNQVEMIAADQLHIDDFTGEGITVAIMDSGFPAVNTIDVFERLRTNDDLLGGYDFVDRTANIYDYTGSSHGTKVLSDMAGYIDNQFVGTAPDASYYLFRTEDAPNENPVEESYWVEAAERADSLGVDIINTSLGYTTYDNPNYSYTPSEMNGTTAFISRGASIAVEKGIVVVTSAGNSGANSWQVVGAPADSPDVLSVGAVDINGDYAFFSSQGSDAQPTQKPDVVAQGLAAFVVDENNGIVQNNGTSFSSPILCGGIAALMQALPDLAPNEIMEIVRQSSSQYSNPDNLLGYGIPDLDLAKSIVLSVSEQEKNRMLLFPNPFNDIVRLQIDEGDFKIRVFNQLGQLVMKEIIPDRIKQIDMSHLSSGFYLIEVSSDKQKNTFKLIKR